MNQRDIAKLAGTSSATVSRVINNDSSVSANTRARIEEIINKYEYIQNAVARNLKMASTKTIGYLEPDIGNPFFPLVLGGIEKVCWSKKYDIIFENTNEKKEKEQAAVKALIRCRVDGLIATFVDSNYKMINSIHKAGIPLILIDRKIIHGEQKSDCINVDNKDGMFQLVDYLANLGHKKISIIHGTKTITSGIERLEGFYKEMERKDLEINEDYILDGDFSEKGGYKCALRLMNLNDPPTAILTANNMMTMGAFKALKEMHVKIPEQVSLAGFDDFPLADCLSPPLTVVNREPLEMGRIAAEMLFDIIENPNAERSFQEVVLPTHLIIRDSCAPVAKYINLTDKLIE